MRDLLGDDLPYLGQGAIGKKAEATIQDWNAGKLPFLALHPAAGGHGLNLQHGGCRHGVDLADLVAGTMGADHRPAAPLRPDQAGDRPGLLAAGTVDR